MKAKLNLAALAIGILLFAGAARATGPDAASNPYRVIYQHSIFGLVPPQPLADVSSAAPPPDIALNGIMSIFGRKYALFKLPSNKGKSYLLGEGQSDGEIELLSVDERAGKIKINNHGVVQTVTLSKPPASSNAPVATVSGAALAIAAVDNSRQLPAADILLLATDSNAAPAAMPAAPAGYAASGGTVNSGNSHSGNSQGGSASGNGTPSAGDSGPQASGGSGDSASKPAWEPWWVIGSKSMEAARIATADMVNSGQAEPWPLTPYTPPGTPANLIGPDQLYFGHGTYQGVDSGAIPGLN